MLGELPTHGDAATFDSDVNVTMAMKALLAVEHKYAIHIYIGWNNKTGDTCINLF